MPDPKVRELFDRTAGLLEEIRMVTDQLEPERARSCRNAITLASVMIHEIRQRIDGSPVWFPRGTVSRHS